ncbi:hypothetical protein BAE44_0017413 [Dichanthelium oligosanthes]|uniref:Uncharacterized protein n=1 Tax=Dichanthelium oligosanthes TaxID=888268 RepID=A0A1E5V933_9POAL|nr:hypothetical protein BAE44_0017413 [Dichanthelium oligosanthes]
MPAVIYAFRANGNVGTNATTSILTNALPAGNICPAPRVATCSIGSGTGNSRKRRRRALASPSVLLQLPRGRGRLRETGARGTMSGADAEEGVSVVHFILPLNQQCCKFAPFLYALRTRCPSVDIIESSTIV